MQKAIPTKNTNTTTTTHSDSGASPSEYKSSPAIAVPGAPAQLYGSPVLFEGSPSSPDSADTQYIEAGSPEYNSSYIPIRAEPEDSATSPVSDSLISNRPSMLSLLLMEQKKKQSTMPHAVTPQAQPAIEQPPVSTEQTSSKTLIDTQIKNSPMKSENTNNETSCWHNLFYCFRTDRNNNTTRSAYYSVPSMKK